MQTLDPENGGNKLPSPSTPSSNLETQSLMNRIDSLQRQVDSSVNEYHESNEYTHEKDLLEEYYDPNNPFNRFLEASNETPIPICTAPGPVSAITPAKSQYDTPHSQKISGFKRRISFHSVKLMNERHTLPSQTNSFTDSYSSRSQSPYRSYQIRTQPNRDTENIAATITSDRPPWNPSILTEGLLQTTKVSELEEQNDSTVSCKDPLPVEAFCSAQTDRFMPIRRILDPLQAESSVRTPRGGYTEQYLRKLSIQKAFSVIQEAEDARNNASELISMQNAFKHAPTCPAAEASSIAKMILDEALRTENECAPPVELGKTKRRRIRLSLINELNDNKMNMDKSEATMSFSKDKLILKILGDRLKNQVSLNNSADLDANASTSNKSKCAESGYCSEVFDELNSVTIPQKLGCRLERKNTSSSETKDVLNGLTKMCTCQASHSRKSQTKGCGKKHLHNWMNKPEDVPDVYFIHATNAWKHGLRSYGDSEQAVNAAPSWTDQKYWENRARKVRIKCAEQNSCTYEDCEEAYNEGFNVAPSNYGLRTERKSSGELNLTEHEFMELQNSSSCEYDVEEDHKDENSRVDSQNLTQEQLNPAIAEYDSEDEKMKEHFGPTALAWRLNALTGKFGNSTELLNEVRLEEERLLSPLKTKPTHLKDVEEIFNGDHETSSPQHDDMEYLNGNIKGEDQKHDGEEKKNSNEFEGTNKTNSVQAEGDREVSQCLVDSSELDEPQVLFPSNTNALRQDDAESPKNDSLSPPALEANQKGCERAFTVSLDNAQETNLNSAIVEDNETPICDELTRIENECLAPPKTPNRFHSLNTPQKLLSPTGLVSPKNAELSQITDLPSLQSMLMIDQVNEPEKKPLVSEVDDLFEDLQSFANSLLSS